MSKEEVENYLKAANTVKSTTISLATNVEVLIELIISGYYTITDKEYFGFAKIFFNDDLELSFYKKIKMLERFLSSFYPEVLKENSELINQLNRVRKLRNHFAHSVNPNEEELKKIASKRLLTLFYVEEGREKKLEVPFADITQRLDDFNKIKNTLGKILELIVIKKEKNYLNK